MVDNIEAETLSETYDRLNAAGNLSYPESLIFQIMLDPYHYLFMFALVMIPLIGLAFWASLVILKEERSNKKKQAKKKKRKTKSTMNKAD